MHHLTLIGAGYSARYIAQKFAAAGFKLSMTSRDAAAAQDILRTFDADLAAKVTLIETDYHQPFLPADCSHLIMTAPVSVEQDAAAWACISADISTCDALTWLGYLSTTGVYGDRDGAWTSEQTPTAPTSERGEKRVAAEQAWAGLAEKIGVALDIIRLTGIYGPNRNALRSLITGKSRIILKENQVFNRIHVEDIAALCLLAAENQGQTQSIERRIFNGADGQPAPPQDVIRYAARLLDMEPPKAIPYEQAALSPMAASFYSENKRISIDAAEKQLGFTPLYQGYEAGLDAALAYEKAKRGNQD